ncbi:MAG TPA: trypsin-like peptidase domain-containing protein [Acidimicrobiia bacterium]|jgi:S1-C subfamily serine protease
MTSDQTPIFPPSESSSAGGSSPDETLAPVLTEDEPSPIDAGQAPTPPPAAAPPAPAAPAAPPSRKGWPLWAILLVALALIAVTAGVTYLVTADRPAADTTAEGGESAQAASPADDVVPGEEPIADVAELILPSVVQIQTNGGVGSGVIYDSDGLILTAAHVVSGSDTVTVRFNDGEEVEGTVLGGTSGADVAVVEVDRTGLVAADLALDDELRVGQMAVAVGSPWGLQGTVTAGIISAVDQSIPSGTSARSVIQTDAAINPGNSGGPLVDREGRVLGINVSIFSLSGANDGVGFAVPIDVAHDIAERVVSGESIETAFLGVMGDDAQSGQAGAVITEVTPDSAADEAGLEVGDLVVSLDGVPVQGIVDLAAQVQSHSPGSTVDVVVVRDGQEQTITVTLGERSDGLE